MIEMSLKIEQRLEPGGYRVRTTCVAVERGATSSEVAVRKLFLKALNEAIARAAKEMPNATGAEIFEKEIRL